MNKSLKTTRALSHLNDVTKDCSSQNIVLFVLFINSSDMKGNRFNPSGAGANNSPLLFSDNISETRRDSGAINEYIRGFECIPNEGVCTFLGHSKVRSGHSDVTKSAVFSDAHLPVAKLAVRSGV